MNVSKPVRWAVVWGDLIDRDPQSGPKRYPENFRIAHNKTTDPRQACKECFGLATADMWVKNLGADVQTLRTEYKRKEALDLDKGTWMRLGNTVSFHSSTKPVYWVDGKFKLSE